jgi:hypothetical protein
MTQPFHEEQRASFAALSNDISTSISEGKHEWVQMHSTVILAYKIRTIKYNKKKLRGFGPLANYADRATAASWQSSTNFSG